MMMWLQAAQAAHETAQQTAPPPLPDAMTYKVIIGTMGGFILMLIAWIKAKDDKLEKLQNERVSDLKDTIRSVK